MTSTTIQQATTIVVPSTPINEDLATIPKLLSDVHISDVVSIQTKPNQIDNRRKKNSKE